MMSGQVANSIDQIGASLGRCFFTSPRVAGVSDHFNRAEWFLMTARRAPSEEFRTWFLLAAVHSARACVEIMLEACSKQEVKGHDRSTFEEWIRPKLRHYALIEKIRIHDFHRFGVSPRDPDAYVSWMGGPVKLTGNKGAASLQMTQHGPVKQQSGNVQLKEQRPLYMEDGKFYDDEQDDYIELESVVYEFLSSLPAVIVRFQNINEG